MVKCPSCAGEFADGTSKCPTDGSTLLSASVVAELSGELASGTKVGEYEIERKLGEGGFGAVYRATQPLIGKSVAIKVLSREFSAKPEIVNRFIDEARAVNQIRNKGIIDIFSFGALPDGRQYFVMELLEGTSLDGHLKARGKLEVAEAIAILRGVARAVDAAHASGIAHRDLKPDNVFLVFDADGTVTTKLLDFGVAKLLGERSGPRTQTGVPIGTPQYMSPEQSRGVDVDTRADIYSFGAMAYEMLTGSVPFTGESVMDILMKQMTATPRLPSEVHPGLPKELDAPLLHMLEKDRDRRPKTLASAVEELTAAANRAGIATAGHVIGSTPSLPSSRSLPGTNELATAQTLVGATSEVGPAPARRPVALYAGVALAVGLLIGVGGFLATRGGNAATTVAPPASTVPAASAATATPPPTVEPTAQPSAAVQTEITVTFTGQPKGTKVLRGAEVVGSAPGAVQLAAASGPIELRLEAPGYVAKSIKVSGDTSSTFAETLDPVKQVPTAKPSGKKSEIENPF